MSGDPIETLNPSMAESSGSLEPDLAGINLLYVIGSLDVGGTERHLALIVPRLLRFGCKPVIYCLARPGHQASQVAEAGIRVISPPFAFAPKQGSVIVRGLKLFLSTLKLFWIMLTGRPRVVHFFLPGSYLIGGPLSLLARVPIRVMSRRSLNDYQAAHPLLHWCELRLHRRMTALVGNSLSVVRELVDEEGSPPDRAALIYNGIDVSAFETRRERNGGLVFITVANLISYKGHSDLLMALGHVAGALPPKWSLLCVGRDDGIGARLKEQARALEIGDNVKFLGARSDVASLLAGADIGILASHEEGFSNSILEGMAAGLPMIVTRVGGNAEAVVQGVTGLVVPPRDAKALSAAILQLALDPGLRRRMGSAGRERVETYFGIDRCINGYVRLYAGLARGERPAEIAGLDPMLP